MFGMWFGERSDIHCRMHYRTGVIIACWFKFILILLMNTTNAKSVSLITVIYTHTATRDGHVVPI